MLDSIPQLLNADICLIDQLSISDGECTSRNISEQSWPTTKCVKLSESQIKQSVSALFVRFLPTLVEHRGKPQNAARCVRLAASTYTITETTIGVLQFSSAERIYCTAFRTRRC